MSNTQIAIRTDDKTKQAIAAFADSLGLSTGAFMLAAAREAMYRESVTLTPDYGVFEADDGDDQSTNSDSSPCSAASKSRSAYDK